MVVTLSNFFYYLFTGLQGHFEDFSGVSSVFNQLLSWVQNLFYYWGGSSSAPEMPALDLGAVVSVILAFVLIIGLAWFVLRTVYRLFTLR